MIDTTRIDVCDATSLAEGADCTIGSASSGGGDSDGDEWAAALRRARIKPWILTLVACVAIAALASCGKAAERSEATGEVTASGEVDAFEVRVGDCLKELPGDLDATEVEDVSAVSAVPCEREHAGEVYDLFLLEDAAEYPGDEEIGTLSFDGCVERFGTFVGLSYELARHDIFPLMPSSESWDLNDDREVVCIIFDPGGPLTDSPRGLGRAAAPAVGSCRDTLAALVDCAAAHDAELYALVDLPDGASPSQKDLDAAAEPACLDQFGVYVGLAYDQSALDFFFVTPDEASWSAGDRLVGCMAFDPAGPLTGSVQGSGR